MRFYTSESFDVSTALLTLAAVGFVSVQLLLLSLLWLIL